MRQQGIAVLSQSFEEDPNRERRIVTEFVRRRVDGLILTTVSKEQGYLSAEAARGTPIVFVDRPAVSVAFDSVVSANFEGAVEATRHLLEHGHRHVAHIGADPQFWTVRERERGFLSEISRWEIPRSQVIVLTDVRDEESARAAVHRLCDEPEPPTAIFAAQNRVLTGTVRAMHELGVQHTVALVGFDDVELLDVVDPGVTVVSQNPRRLGELAAQRLLARMTGAALELETLTVPTTLVVRGSGEIAGPYAEVMGGTQAK
jgi:LacI family transcriptional regulator